MKLITTRVGTFLTGTEIADAVLHYALVLTRARLVDAVDIPIISQLGRPERAMILVGSTAEIATTTAPPQSTELVDPSNVTELYDRAASVGVVKALPFTTDELSEAYVPPDAWDD